MEDLFGCVIVILVGCVMLSIGIVQYRKSGPVGFYSGEKPPRPDELTDVTEWNHKHGMLWMGFGLSIFLGCLLGFLLRDSMICAFFFIGGVVIPLPVMILLHQKYVKKYRKQLPK